MEKFAGYNLEILLYCLNSENKISLCNVNYVTCWMSQICMTYSMLSGNRMYMCWSVSVEKKPLPDVISVFSEV